MMVDEKMAEHCDLTLVPDFPTRFALCSAPRSMHVSILPPPKFSEGSFRVHANCLSRCDESLPQCRVCSTRGLQRQYATLQVLDEAPSLSSTRSPSPTNNTSPVTNTPSQTSTSLPDALRWQHYLTHASKTITSLQRRSRSHTDVGRIPPLPSPSVAPWSSTL